MTAPILCIHGWGMGPEVWHPLRIQLTGRNLQLANLGFSGPSARPLAAAPIIIAHSLGLMWALAHVPLPWSGLIAVNSFTRFTRSEDGFPGVEPRLVARMQARLDSDPTQVVGDFLTRCGLSQPPPGPFDAARLAEGLEMLHHGDQRQTLQRLHCPILAIGGGADPIVTPSHSRACFPHPQIIEDGGHLLPLTHTSWLAQRIAAALAGDWSP